MDEDRAAPLSARSPGWQRDPSVPRHWCQGDAGLWGPPALTPEVASGFCFPGFCSPALEQGQGLSSSRRSPGCWPAASSGRRMQLLPESRRMPGDHRRPTLRGCGVLQVLGDSTEGKTSLCEGRLAEPISLRSPMMNTIQGISSKVKSSDPLWAKARAG